MQALLYILVVITGDSHAVGTPGQLLAAELRRQGHEVRLQGLVGARANSTRWSCKADWQIVFLGSNEMPSSYLARVYQSIGSRAKQTIIVGPPASSRGRVRAVAELLSGAEIDRYIDSRKCTDVRESSDGLHYGKAGAERWVKCLLSHPLLGVVRR
jgi:hypothetical protein